MKDSYYIDKALTEPRWQAHIDRWERFVTPLLIATILSAIAVWLTDGTAKIALLWIMSPIAGLGAGTALSVMIAAGRLAKICRWKIARCEDAIWLYENHWNHPLVQRRLTADKMNPPGTEGHLIHLQHAQFLREDFEAGKIA